jgi:hypothetical protein
MGSRGLLWVWLWEVKILWVRIMGVTLVTSPSMQYNNRHASFCNSSVFHL